MPPGMVLLICLPLQLHLAERDESCCCDQKVSDHQDCFESFSHGEEARC